MADRGALTLNHMDHVHVSLIGDGSSNPAAGADGNGGGCPAPGGQPGIVNRSGWAAPAAGPITDAYGPRVDPITGAAGFHHGVDLGAPCDAPIWAANAGTVVRAGPASIYGNLIEIDHGGGVHTRYGHMFDSGLLVRVGDRVTAGQQIAAVGSNGYSTGCHLHFEVLTDGQNVDPVAFLAGMGVTIPT